MLFIAAQEAVAATWPASPLTVVVSIATLFGMVSMLVLCTRCCGEPEAPNEDSDMHYLEKHSSRRNLPDIVQQDQETGHRAGAKRSFLKSRRKTSKYQPVMNNPPTPYMSVESVQPGREGGAQFMDPRETSQSQLDEVSTRARHGKRRMAVLNIFRGLDNLVMEDSPDEKEKEPRVRGEDKGLGVLEFTVQYDFTCTTLVVTCSRARDLPAADYTGTSDPYVRICLDSGKRTRMQTKVKKKKLNPVWNESFRYEGFPVQKLSARVLMLQVRDYDRFSRDDILGEVQLPLSELNLSEGPIKLVYHLQPSALSKGFLGELQLSLTYKSAVARLVVGVLRGRNLKAMDLVGGSDPYVKIWCKQSGMKKEKKKTKVIHHTLNPVWNETFMFDLPHTLVKDTAFHFYTMDHDILGRNDSIGEVVFSNVSSGKELAHWQKAMHKPGETVTEWHVLRAKEDS